ncbi:MAG: hypothetical protein LBI03_01355, partial [Clostridiales bacterium]|nr:hypothetical protein [Clostridiales bacterium]
WETNEVQLPNAAFEAMWTISTELLYVKYDIEKDYIPQFEMNLADMWRMFNKLDTELIQPFLRGELT